MKELCSFWAITNIATYHNTSHIFLQSPWKFGNFAKYKIQFGFNSAVQQFNVYHKRTQQESAKLCDSALIGTAEVLAKCKQ